MTLCTAIKAKTKANYAFLLTDILVFVFKINKFHSLSSTIKVKNDFSCNLTNIQKISLLKSFQINFSLQFSYELNSYFLITKNFHP